MKAGKLPLELLCRLLNKIDLSDPRVVMGPRPGEDAALIDMGDRTLVAATDPITFATDDLGWYVVQVNANDVAVMGATPRWLLATLLLPEGTSERQAQRIFDQLLEACRALGVTLVGGHTEITVDLPRPMAVGAMLGEVAKGKQVLTGGAVVGDAIVLTRGVAIEGTSILAREAAPSLRSAGVPDDVIGRASRYLFSPGISVVTDARVACDTAPVHAMHDPTEGGVAGGLLELARAAGAGLSIDADAIIVLAECDTCCAALGLDPLGLLASGALLVTLAAADAPRLIDALDGQGIPAADIGRVSEASQGLKLRTSSGERDLPVFERDELARFLSG
jgi:hydrogenase expression/formation protein HypE